MHQCSVHYLPSLTLDKMYFGGDIKYIIVKIIKLSSNHLRQYNEILRGAFYNLILKIIQKY